MKRVIIVCLIAVALLAVLSIVAPGAEAVNRTWTGSTNTAWANSNNWNPTGVPSSSSVTLPVSGAEDDGAKANHVVGG